MLLDTSMNLNLGNFRPAEMRFGAFLLLFNLVWETVQIPLYTIWQTGTFASIATAIIHCTIGDLLIGGFALTISLALLRRGWPSRKTTRIQMAIMTTLIGVTNTIFSEWLNVVVRQTWAYSDLMPTLPPLGTGLSPILQWIIIPSLALHFATRQLASSS